MCFNMYTRDFPLSSPSCIISRHEQSFSHEMREKEMHWNPLFFCSWLLMNGWSTPSPSTSNSSFTYKPFWPKKSRIANSTSQWVWSNSISKIGCNWHFHFSLFLTKIWMIWVKFVGLSPWRPCGIYFLRALISCVEEIRRRFPRHHM